MCGYIVARLDTDVGVLVDWLAFPIPQRTRHILYFLVLQNSTAQTKVLEKVVHL